ncbi:MULTISPECIES: CaiB/BaiF CoA-transferase family protein [Mycolicibacterium]|uniref:L-carnitine dehydratase/bile acid-inducible protein F n=1 Tax=Mycolicibacterium thermoresistibile TaxID=1797 RepID=A0A117INX9_MYCTH|nr:MULTISPECIES: CaiB/BaiF CoA-transferase family protein [Mycolicibacterium]MCV7186735.1 CoA transferase [Mycolicibacterium thermoresistibile]GAT17651.1 L-carnitine dehydratase/bile acid-inducible protein F [Mycolicibacterium thermoresistibile]SNW19396.1 L-carnitine dehydratase/bile acid-inducible protein F [Mycolicibacterium thermoresistibile]
MTDILKGVRVIEVAAWTFVPAAGAVLADWGADVIKVEHPETGDPQRGLVSSGIVAGAGGVNHFIEQPNRGKRSIGLDTSTPEGLEVLMKLVETADVFLTNLLPDSRQRMGIDVEQVRARNPKIIYARGHGYGTKGDLATQGGFDLAAYWARGGIGEAYAAGDGSYPPIQRPAFGDVYGGLTIAAGIAGALFKRERTGKPSVVDVSLLGAAIWQLGPDVVGAGVIGADIPKFNLPEMPNPVASMYQTRDGRHIAFVLLQADRFWADFCTRLGRTDLIDDERFANAAVRFENRVACIAELRKTFASQDLPHWEKAFEGFDGVWDVMRTAREIHDDPQVIANGYLPRTTDAHGNEFALAASPVQFDETPLSLRCAPGHGEHTDELLAELGYDEDAIIDLKIKSVAL